MQEVNTSELKKVGNQYYNILPRLKELGSAKILDVGAGEGIKKYLSKDFTYKTLDFGEKYDYNFNIDKGKLPIKDKEFDVVLCMETLEHVMYPKRVLKEIKRVVKDNGTVFISMPNEFNFVQRIYYLIGKKTLVDEPFEVVEKHLHIHKPRVKDIVNVVGQEFKIKRVWYIWQSRASMTKRWAYFIDRGINLLAQIYPSMFARIVLVEAEKI